MLSPVTLGCKTKTPKIIGIAITVLQRLVAAGGVPTVRRFPLWCPTLISACSPICPTNSQQRLEPRSRYPTQDSTSLIVCPDLQPRCSWGNTRQCMSTSRSQANDRPCCSASNSRMFGYQSSPLLQPLLCDKLSCSSSTDCPPALQKRKG